METKVRMKDGVEVLIRPMAEDDFERSYDFFQTLTEEDRVFLRADVSDPEVIRMRVQKAVTGSSVRLVAIDCGRIVADGTLELERQGWKKHMGEVRLFVAPTHQRKGLGLLMARELYVLAQEYRVEELIVKMMRPQKGARRIFKKLGFTETSVLLDYVKDISGKKQDLIIMRSDMKNLWREWEEFIALSDWNRTR